MDESYLYLILSQNMPENLSIYTVTSKTNVYIGQCQGRKIFKVAKTRGGGTRLWLGRGVPPGPRDPNPCLEVKKVPMFRDFAQKMDPCLGMF